jgi:D-lactate dehydrogenase
LIRELRTTGADVGVRASDRLAAAHDASHYLLVPQAVVTAHDAEELAATLRAARRAGATVTFRSGGTSLSGQAGTDGVLIDTRQHFRGITVQDDGALVRAQPGATVRAVNARLLHYGRKLGPDPASEIACTIGGVVANNSSGMCCGTSANTYRTLDSAVLVLPSGTLIDTGAADADERLHEAEPEIYAGLEQLRDRVRSNPESLRIIAQLYAIKNTMGYGVNSFVDYDRPVDILAHLAIGSEGTLAFVAEARFRTLPVSKHVATGLLIFPDLAAATAALPAIVDGGFAAIELMDATSLRVAQRDPAATPELLALTVENHAALLVEHQQRTAADLAEKAESAERLISTLPLALDAELTTDAATRSQLWTIRKGLYTTVEGNRRSGTTALLEDIAVPVERLLVTCTELSRLFDAHGYEDSVIFGHAKDGNIHFMLNEQFDATQSLERYQAFTEDMVRLVLSRGGTLKAEHGTGRIMAPFVHRQYGDELYAVMCEVKELIDPDGLLNPGVLISDDPMAHVRNLKRVQTVEPEVDRCVECGYCEPVCPSRDLTLTPRKRIALRREIAIAARAGDLPLLDELRRDYAYDGVQTCAVDGMCGTACPLLINTGDLVRRLRGERQPAALAAGWKFAARHWDGATRTASVALSLARAVPTVLPGGATVAGRALLGADIVPRYSAGLPGGGRRRRASARAADAQADAVYFASCMGTMFGPAEPGSGGVSQALRELCARAAVALTTPDDLPSLCCGTPWKSKGLHGGYEVMKRRVAASLRRATRGGELPVVCDGSSCTEGLQILVEAAGEQDIRVLDAVEFVADVVLPKLPAGEKVTSLTLHPTCSSTRMGINGSLQRVAEAAATEVIVPDEWGCCGFAGDRGMLHPELTAAATAAEAAAVAAAGSAVHASLNRTCELGMARATGKPYRHILEILADTLRGGSYASQPATGLSS